MKVVEHKTYEVCGEVMEGERRGDLVVRPSSTFTIEMNKLEVSKLLCDLEKIDRREGITQKLLAKLKKSFDNDVLKV